MVSFSEDWEGFSLRLRVEATPKPKGIIINTSCSDRCLLYCIFFYYSIRMSEQLIFILVKNFII